MHIQSVITTIRNNNSSILKVSLCSFVVNPIPHPQPLATTDLFSAPVVLSFPECHVNRIITWFYFIFGFLQQFSYAVFPHAFLWVYPVWGSLNILNLQIYVFHQYWEVFSQCFFRYFFCSNYFLFSFWISSDS